MRVTLSKDNMVFIESDVFDAVIGEKTAQDLKAKLNELYPSSTAELVLELRKRDGVEVINAFVKWQRDAPNKILVPSIDTEIRTHHCGMKVTAIILRITD